MRRNRYHTDFIFKARIGLLSEDERSLVPDSTYSEWQNRDFKDIIGFDTDDSVLHQIEFHRKFLAVKSLAISAKCLWIVYTCFTSIFEKTKSRLKLFRKHKELIIESIQAMNADIGITSACRMFGISVNLFYRWLNEKVCSSSVFEFCRKTNSQQLSIKEQKAVEEVLSRPALKDKPRITGYYRMMKEKLAFMNYSTFCRYANQLFGEVIRKKKLKQPQGKRANKPFELLHMDTTVVKFMDGTKAFVHLIVDNYSRTILGWKIARTCSSLLVVENLKEVCKHHNLYYKPLKLWCDNGTENEGEVNTFLLGPDIEIEKQIAQVDIHYSNSMSEAANKRLKYFHLLPRQLGYYEELTGCMSETIENENNREQGALFGYTPLEVLKGKVPDKHLFSKQIQKAKKERSSINRKQKCPIC